MFKPRNVLAVASLSALAAASTADAQVPGLPVLQNAFSNPGLGLGANVGGGGGESFLGLAAAWAPRSGRFQVSAGAGAQKTNDSNRGAYGGRASATVWTSRAGSLGVGAFAGFGGAPRTRDDNVVTNAAVVTAPVGATVSYRRPLGSRRGFSVYGSPMYRWTRFTIEDGTTNDDQTISDGAFRFALGLDIGITRSLGGTIGGEFGSGGDEGAGNFGVAVSWVPGARGN